MPELPETETIARDLQRTVAGARITAVRVRRPDVVREVSPRTLVRRVRNAVIERCWRRAKHVVIGLSTGDRLVVQPRFTGGFILEEEPLPEPELRYSAVAFILDDGRKLHYRDVRRLGTVALMSADRFEAYFGALGVEPLDPGFTADRLHSIAARSRQAIKKLLMDQHHIVGVGNIYANEALWLAGIDPSRVSATLSAGEAAALRDAVVTVLQHAIDARGTSFRDYRDAEGGLGEFEPLLSAYGRAGLPCPRCGARLVGTHAVDGRQTVFCARCQK